MIGLLLGAAVTTASPLGVATFVRDHPLSRYSIALVDLNDDGHAEALVYAMDATRCGSGGCDLYVLSLNDSAYRIVTDISLVRPPVSVLPTITQGWHDLSVQVAGGGIVPGYAARLRFNGSAYPSNPTVLPAAPLEGRTGRVLIRPVGGSTAVITASKAPCPGETTQAVNACLSGRLRQSDATLNIYYQAALRQIEADAAKSSRSFVQAERSWIAYRDAECVSAAGRYEGGTIATSVELDCRIRLTAFRTYAIWRDWLTFPDGTPPVLPAPEIGSVLTTR